VPYFLFRSEIKKKFKKIKKSCFPAIATWPWQFEYAQVYARVKAHKTRHTREPRVRVAIQLA
jgi:hypothetical protein